VVALSGNHLATAVVVVVATGGGGATCQIAALVIGISHRRAWRRPQLVRVFLEVLGVADGWSGGRIVGGISRTVDTRVGLCTQNKLILRKL